MTAVKIAPSSMYGELGPLVDHVAGTVKFRLFFPDHTKDSCQYFQEYIVKDDKGRIIAINQASLPNIDSIEIAGNFPASVGKLTMKAPVPYPAGKPKGILYESNDIKIPEGFYHYNFVVTFKNREIRVCNDPCTKYHTHLDGRDCSGFVIGGNLDKAELIRQRLPLKDLIIYELMIDDFISEMMIDESNQILKSPEAPLDLIRKKINYLKDLGVNAIEFMPWTAWPGGGFNWGYMPFLNFSVTNRYSQNMLQPLDKLSKLKLLITELHRNNIHVIMDGVFNHVCNEFPYLQLYENPSLSPFIGVYSGTGFGNDLDFNNICTQEFILDVCKYWIDEFKIDGIRFDYSLGFYKKDDTAHGITKLISELNSYVTSQGYTNISFILEHLTDNRYDAIDDTNIINASGCWFDKFMWNTFDYLANGHIDREIMRILDSCYCFAPGKVPVTYIENHDHSSVMNAVRGDNKRLRWWKTQPFAIALLTSPGAVMIHNGQEFGQEYWMPEKGDGRVLPRKLSWALINDPIGKKLFYFYKGLISIRENHPALRSPNFYPSGWYEDHFNNEGYGFDKDKQVVIYHRWGNDSQGNLKRYIIVINFSDIDQTVDIPFPANGKWKELLSGKEKQVSNFRAENEIISSNWGRIYVQE
jgi:1,4-alpha-glucan branching enzyme